jgi:hypothetical protein
MYGTQFAQIIPPRALDSDQSHFLHHLAGSDLSANRDLTWLTGDADRQATMQGDPTLDDWFDQSVKTSASPTFAGLGVNGVITAESFRADGDAGGGSASTVTMTNETVSPGSGGKATLGKVAVFGPGPGSTSQSLWLKIYAGSTDYWIPIWT